MNTIEEKIKKLRNLIESKKSDISYGLDENLLELIPTPIRPNEPAPKGNWKYGKEEEVEIIEFFHSSQRICVSHALDKFIGEFELSTFENSCTRIIHLIETSPTNNQLEFYFRVLDDGYGQPLEFYAHIQEVCLSDEKKQFFDFNFAYFAY